MVPPFCTFSLHLAALRDLAFLSAASVFKHQLKYDGGHFYTIYSLLLHHHAAGGAGVRGHLKKIRRVTKAHPLAKFARV